MRLLVLLIILLPVFAMAEMVDYESNGFIDYIKFPSSFSKSATSLYAKSLYDAMIRVTPKMNGMKEIILKNSGVKINCEKAIAYDMERYSCRIYMINPNEANGASQDEIDGLIVTSLTKRDSEELYRLLKRPNEQGSYDVGYYSYMAEIKGIQKLVKIFDNGPLEIFCSKNLDENPSCRISFDIHKNF